MKSTIPHSLRMFMTLFLVTLALCAIPVAGTEWNTISTAEAGDINPDAGDDDSRWNTSVLINNVSSDYPGACWGTRVFAAATGPGDVFYLTYYDINRNALVLARVDNGKTTAEKVVSSARSCGVSLDINPVTGTPAVSYRARNSTPIFAYKQNGSSGPTEVVDPDVSEGYSTSLAFDRTGTPHLAYDDGSSFSNLMYGTRNPDGTWTREIADQGNRRAPGKCREKPAAQDNRCGRLYCPRGRVYLFVPAVHLETGGKKLDVGDGGPGLGRDRDQFHNRAYRGLPHLHHGAGRHCNNHLRRCPEPDAHEGPGPSGQ